MDGNWDAFIPGDNGITNGFKGWKVGGNLTLAKNMVAEVDYYDLKGKEGDQNGKHARTLWSQLVVTFNGLQPGSRPCQRSTVNCQWPVDRKIPGINPGIFLYKEKRS